MHNPRLASLSSFHTDVNNIISRNPIHSQRPHFSDISSMLSASNSTLLQWTGDDNRVCGKLGGQLYKTHLLYEDLQRSYL